MNGRYYNVTVIGGVQDIGFRSFIENTANSYHVRGYVFNLTFRRSPSIFHNFY